MIDGENGGDLTPARPRIDLSDFGYDAERKAELERAGYQISQKRDGGWWWSDRDADDGPFEGNDSPLPDESAAITQAWRHLQRARAETPAGFVVPGLAEIENAVRAGVAPPLADHLDKMFGPSIIARKEVPLRPGEEYTPPPMGWGLCPAPGHRFETDAEFRERIKAESITLTPGQPEGNLSITVDGPGLGGETPKVDPADLPGRAVSVESIKEIGAGELRSVKVSGTRFEGADFDTTPAHEAVLELHVGTHAIRVAVDAKPLNGPAPIDRARIACIARMAGMSYMRAAALTVAELDALTRQAVEQHPHGIIDYPDGEGGAALVLSYAPLAIAKFGEQIEPAKVPRCAVVDTPDGVAVRLPNGRGWFAQGNLLPDDAEAKESRAGWHWLHSRAHKAVTLLAGGLSGRECVEVAQMGEAAAREWCERRRRTLEEAG